MQSVKLASLCLRVLQKAFEGEIDVNDILVTYTQAFSQIIITEYLVCEPSKARGMGSG